MKIYIQETCDIPKIFDDVLMLVREDQPTTPLLTHLNHTQAIIARSYQNKEGRRSNAHIISGKLVEGKTFNDLQEFDVLQYATNKHTNHELSVAEFQISEQAITLNDTVLDDLTIASHIIQTSDYVAICDEKHIATFSRAIEIAKTFRGLYDIYPSYQHIMIPDENGEPTHTTLLQLLLDVKEPMRTELSQTMINSSSFFATIKTAAESILQHAQVDKGYNLMTQEEQVEAFIQFSKTLSSNKREVVSGELIDKIKQSPEYQSVLDIFDQQGFGISTTQQYNVLQTVGLMSKNVKNKHIYNLSDMGAGKTLMTVESLYLLDLKNITSWTAQMADSDTSQVVEVQLSEKHIIAPTLSIKSSWIKTFELFYDVTQIDDFTYRATITRDDVSYSSNIHVASFTVKTGTIFVDAKLPAILGKGYLIIDEVHQLLQKPISRTKFFDTTTIPNNTYRSFVLSGTLSNLTSQEWYNYVRFMDISFNDDDLDGGSHVEMRSRVEHQIGKFKRHIEHSATTITEEQFRKFDPTSMDESQKYQPNQKKLTAKEELFQLKYAPKALYLRNDPQSVQDALSKASHFQLYTNPQLTDAPNFQLFYQLIGDRSITAQSLQIAEELFGEQKQQHAADVINVKSPLSRTDIQLLKTLHRIAEDHAIYKSTRIAEAINVAILNLNDGLQPKNVYEIISKYASTNTRFLEYLASLDINVLEKLPESGLIQSPNLEDTDKFKVLQDILQKEQNETHLIVVNDYPAMKMLATKLGITCLTKKQVSNQLDYQDVIDDLFKQQSIVIVTQSMIKSSLDLIQANRLIQYQLNTEISDIIQTQNRINRIGQTRETRAYYIASDALQENIIELFLETYRNIRVAHKGIVELFVDLSSQINVINDYITKAMDGMSEDDDQQMLEQTNNATNDTIEQPIENPIESAMAHQLVWIG